MSLLSDTKMTDRQEFVSGRIELTEIDAALLGALLRDAIRIPSADFGSAHFLYNLIPRLDVERYNSLANYGNKRSRMGMGFVFGKPTPPFPGLQPLEPVLRKMVRSETSLQFEDSQFQGLFGLTTRDVMAHVLDRISREDRPLAFPLPNWHFWDLNHRGLRLPEFVYFNARNPAELLEGAEDAIKRKGARALMLVNPSNPLLYELADGEAQTLASIASHYGVDVIVDDVLRGTRPLSARNSTGRFFETPYVVEGLSKRFGDEPFGKFSYVIFPRRPLNIPQDIPQNTLEAGGGILEMALHTCSEPALEELCARNTLFDKGFGTENHGVQVCRPYASSLTSLLAMPAGYPLSGNDFSRSVFEKGGIAINPMDAFYPTGYQVPTDMNRFLRITVGRIDREDMESAGRYLAFAFNTERESARG